MHVSMFLRVKGTLNSSLVRLHASLCALNLLGCFVAEEDAMIADLSRVASVAGRLAAGLRCVNANRQPFVVDLWESASATSKCLSAKDSACETASVPVSALRWRIH